MNIRKLSDKKPTIVVFQGSPRKADSCANQKSKTEKVVEHIVNQWLPFANFDVIDLGIGDVRIQPCKGCVSTANGMHCHWKCIAEDQRVHTQKGFVEIKDIKVGDILQDGNKVLKHVKTSESEDVYELKLKDGRRLELTNEHKVKVLSKERYRTLETNWKYFRVESWVELKDIKVGDLIPTTDLDISFVKNNKEVDLDYLSFGLIWGDGTFANDSALLYVDSKEEMFLDRIKNTLSDYIISILPHKVDHTRKINDDYKEYDTEMLKINFGAKFGRKMKETGFLKTKAKTRRLNLESFGNDSNKIFSFLSGWISTDGHINSKGITIYNTSYECLRDTQLLLSRIGIKSSVSDVRHLEIEAISKKTQRCSSLHISGYESVKIIYDNIKLIHPSKQEKLDLFIDNLKKKMVNKPSLVQSIKYIGKKPVYDIEVENSHEFNCEGIKIHNCSCYTYGMEENPDLMYEADIYTRLENCDGFIVVTPIHWYSVSTQVKAMFDRLVCANLTITKEQARQIFGKGNTKNSQLTGRAELSGKYKHLLKNHLEGKFAGFIAHGDNGANDYGNNPPSIGDEFWSVRNNVMPLVYQCRFSGIHCPDDLVEAVYINEGISYYQANMEPLDLLYNLSDGVVERMLDYINNF